MTFTQHDRELRMRCIEAAVKLCLNPRARPEGGEMDDVVKEAAQLWYAWVRDGDGDKRAAEIAASAHSDGLGEERG